MPYATADTVKSEFPALQYSSSTDQGITEAEVTTWCDEFSAYIDSKLQNRYVVPITGTEALKVLSMICKDLVVGKMKMKLFLTSGGKAEDQRAQSVTLTKQSEDRLKSLNLGEAILVGAPTSNVPAGDSYGRKSGQESKFKIEEQQW